MGIDWTYRKDCSSFSLYEKVGIANIIISIAECWYLTSLNLIVGSLAVILYCVFIVLITQAEKHNIIDVRRKEVSKE